MSRSGVIIRSLAGFYDVKPENEESADGAGVIRCRARGLFRRDGVSPLVGDRVLFDETGEGTGYLTELLPRRNSFVRPAVANVDLLVVVAAGVNPVTDPYLIDRVTVIAANNDCDVIIAVNKIDMDPAVNLMEIYGKTEYELVPMSAITGEGIDRLRELIDGHVSAFTGNSGVGKSSILNMLNPELEIPVGEVSEKLGRGRHTTRHVELFDLGGGTFIADTPGFASFDVERMEGIPKENLQFCFPEFERHLATCRYNDCAHLKEPGCNILEAVAAGEISGVRHESYERLYRLAAQVADWERN